eukprot:gene21916-27994_t
MHRNASTGDFQNNSSRPVENLQRRQSEHVSSSRHKSIRNDEEMARELQRQLLSESRQHQEHEAAMARKQQQQTLSDQEMARELQRQLEYEDAYQQKNKSTHKVTPPPGRTPEEQFYDEEEAQELERQAAELLRVQQGDMIFETGSQASDLTFEEEVFLERLPHAALTVGGEHYDPHFQQKMARKSQTGSVAPSLASGDRWTPPRDAQSVASSHHTSYKAPQMSPAAAGGGGASRQFFPPPQGEMRSPQGPSQQQQHNSPQPQQSYGSQLQNMRSPSRMDSFSPAKPVDGNFSPAAAESARSQSRGAQRQQESGGGGGGGAQEEEYISSAKTQLQLQHEMYAQFQRDREPPEQPSSRPSPVRTTSTLQRTSSFLERNSTQPQSQEREQQRVFSPENNERGNSHGHRRTESNQAQAPTPTHEQSSGRYAAPHFNFSRQSTDNAVIFDPSSAASPSGSSPTHRGTPLKRNMTAKISVLVNKYETVESDHNAQRGGVEQHGEGSNSRQLSRHSSTRDMANPFEGEQNSSKSNVNTSGVLNRRGSQKILSVDTMHGTSQSTLLLQTSKSTPSSNEIERHFPSPPNMSPVVTAQQHVANKHIPSEYNQKMDSIRKQSGLSLNIGAVAAPSPSQNRSETPTAAALAQSQRDIIRSRQIAAELADEQMALQLQKELNASLDFHQQSSSLRERSPSPSIAPSMHSRGHTLTPAQQQCKDDEELAREYQSILDARLEKKLKKSPRGGAPAAATAVVSTLPIHSESFHSKASSGNSSGGKSPRNKLPTPQHKTLERMGHNESFYSKTSTLSDGSHGHKERPASAGPVVREIAAHIEKQSPSHKRSPSHKLPSPHHIDGHGHNSSGGKLADTVKPKGIASQPSDSDLIDAMQSTQSYNQEQREGRHSPVNMDRSRQSLSRTQSTQNMSPTGDKISPSGAGGIRGLSSHHSKSFSVSRSPSMSPVPHDRNITQDFSGLPGPGPSPTHRGGASGSRPISGRQ